MPSFRYEISLGRKSGVMICGVDEAGRGPLAGPVVACATILPLAGISTWLLGALDDSKRLSAETREEVAAKLRVKAVYAVAEASIEEIDRHNILQATFVALRRAVDVGERAVLRA
jgi:ribonuclease HII